MFVCLFVEGRGEVTCRRGRGFQRVFELCQFRCSLVNGHGPLIDGVRYATHQQLVAMRLRGKSEGGGAGG